MHQETLYVQMFGEFSLTYADKQISCQGNRSKLIWNLLAYLLIHRGEFVPAEELIYVLWKHEKNDNPASAMRTAIHRVRAMLNDLVGDASVPFLIFKNGGYMWNPEVNTVVDTDTFEKLVASVSDSEDAIGAHLAALDVYRGKLLALQSSELWVMPLQTYYHNLYEALVDGVAPLLEANGRRDECIRLCSQALAIDAYSEKIYQHLMRSLLAKGDRQNVIRTYEHMSKLLLSTFGVMPDQESRALYREALSADAQVGAISPEIAQEQLLEQGEIHGALVCDYDFFKMMYQAHARAIVRSGQVIHTVLLTLKPKGPRPVADRSISLAMDNLENHLRAALRKGDLIARCSSSQFMIMLLSSSYENSCKVCKRFIASFEKKYPHSPLCVDHYVQAMIPSTQS